MSLLNIGNQELLARLEKLVRTERKITHLILVHILEAEDRKLYAERGFDSMYSYLTKGLGYSEASAYRRLQSARLLKQVPTAAEKIEEGSLNLSQLAQVQKCIREQSKRTGEVVSKESTIEILGKIQNKNSFETEKVLAQEFDLPVQMHESLKPQKDESIRIEMTLSKEQFAQLELAKSLLSHVCPEGTWADVISYLATNFNKRKLKGRSRRSSEGLNDVDISNERSADCTDG